MANHKLPVIIIGSGCTGLALANGFMKAGIPTIVFEKNSALSSSSEREWNMGIHCALPTLLALLPKSSMSELQSTQTDPHTPTKFIDTLSFLNGLMGSILMAQQDPNFHRLRESKLRALLSKDIDIRYNN
ncbi:hypothetical protein B7494_g1002 [Chlorociboria aeruginascens]|nr:hypothetical protein B7494_g1002 [Chlorociboria aeruginascens]